jgi:hypothetical protein
MGKQIKNPVKILTSAAAGIGDAPSPQSSAA